MTIRTTRLRPREKPPEKPEPGLRSAIESISSVIAPATLLVALGIYIGWRRTDSYTRYLGIDETLLQYSPQDYLLRSWQSAGQVVFTLVLGTLVAAVVNSVIKRFLPTKAVRAVAWTLIATSGLMLLGLLVSQLAHPVDLWVSAAIYDVPWLSFPALTAFTAATLIYALSLVCSLQTRITSSLAILLLFLGVLSATDKWVTLLGEADAAYLTTTLGQRQGVIVYSKENLNLPRAVTCTERATPNEAYRFRCEGLRLFIRAADKYFLLPSDWSRADSDAQADLMIVLRDDPSLRFEFTPG